MGMKEGNSDPCMNLIYSALPCFWLNAVFEVEANNFAIVINSSKEGKQTKIYGPGNHNISCFNKLQGIYNFHEDYPNNLIESDIGDFKVARVNQGFIMHFDCSGQNVILPPGIHLIRDPMIYQ